MNLVPAGTAADFRLAAVLLGTAVDLSSTPPADLPPHRSPQRDRGPMRLRADHRLDVAANCDSACTRWIGQKMYRRAYEWQVSPAAPSTHFRLKRRATS